MIENVRKTSLGANQKLIEERQRAMISTDSIGTMCINVCVQHSIRSGIKYRSNKLGVLAEGLSCATHQIQDSIK